MAVPKLTLKSGYKNNDGEQRVILTYRAKGEKDFLRKTTGVFCRKGYLNNNVISDPGLHPNIRKERQEVLDLMLNRFKKLLKDFEEEGKKDPAWRVVDAKFEEIYNPKPEPVPVVVKEKKQLNPLQSFQAFIDATADGSRRGQNSKKIGDRTVVNYKVTQKNLLEFQKLTGFNLNSWDNITDEFYFRFTDYCFDDLNHYDNTVGKTVRQIRAWLGWCKEKGIISAVPYNRKWKVWEEKEVDSLVLWPDELKVIGRLPEEKFNVIKNGIRTRDLFLLGCLTCVRVSDLFKLKEGAGYVEKRGTTYYFGYDQDKTDGNAGVEIAPIGSAIIEKYNNTEEGFPIIHDVTFNKDLKEFGRFMKRYFIKNKAELEKEGLVLQNWEKPFSKRRRKRGEVVTIEEVDRDKFTSHLMRRTGITSLAIAGLTKDEIKKVSGHSTDSELDKYIKVADRFRNKNISNAWASILG
ncbi:phage integrase SAM-like domain-containing protein [Nafulsella turpanensis]|uniref:phage integrase SAM-like domain-containing protein n=1 Tax=Nafulsella turpanensis TaxID=1265690 RepID=UPI000348415A|nr:phage integrase SAM-like domain-containing protein [Nafulsella turpanensis]